jgi:hypothetical protein
MRGAFLIGTLVVTLIGGAIVAKRMHGTAPKVAHAAQVAVPKNAEEVTQLQERLEQQAKAAAAASERSLQTTE